MYIHLPSTTLVLGARVMGVGGGGGVDGGGVGIDVLDTRDGWPLEDS
ncbi:hypothetical protein Tco_1534102, partial [Tanacetum coccineum]